MQKPEIYACASEQELCMTEQELCMCEQEEICSKLKHVSVSTVTRHCAIFHGISMTLEVSMSTEENKNEEGLQIPEASHACFALQWHACQEYCYTDAHKHTSRT